MNKGIKFPSFKTGKGGSQGGAKIPSLRHKKGDRSDTGRGKFPSLLKR